MLADSGLRVVVLAAIAVLAFVACGGDPTMPATPSPPTLTTTPAPAVCTTPAEPDCIRAVYMGAPGDYVQVQDIPAGVILTANSDGRYYVERGRQYTVVTAAQLPTGWTRFYLERTPLGTPEPVSFSQLIPPVGTTYTFTVTTDPGASTLITFDLKQARPFVRPRPDRKPEIGDTVVTTVFQIPTFRYDSYDPTGEAVESGSYAFTMTEGSVTTGATTHEDLIWDVTGIVVNVTDGDGSSRVTFYASIQVGDVVEWVPMGDEDCWQRYKVAAILPDPGGSVARKRFSLEPLTKFLQDCGGPIDHKDGALTTELRWNPPAARPAPDGIPEMLLDQPVTGPITVGLAPFSALLIDIPAGMSMVRTTPWVLTSDGDYVAGLDDVESGSWVSIDFKTGQELERVIVEVEGDTRDLGALFDQIVASARKAVGE